MGEVPVGDPTLGRDVFVASYRLQWRSRFRYPFRFRASVVALAPLAVGFVGLGPVLIAFVVTLVVGLVLVVLDDPREVDGGAVEGGKYL